MSSLLLVALIGTVLTNTFLLMHNDESLGGDRRSGSTANAIRIGGGTWTTMLLAAILAALVRYAFTNLPTDTTLLLYAFWVVIVAILLHRMTRRRLPKLRRSLASSPVLIVANSLALGTLLLRSMSDDPWYLAVFYAVVLGAAFLGALALFVALVARITENEVPAAFRLAPVTFISAGLFSLALMGFTGLIRI
jgi:Na+-translocating ferredoxin:NAD+ oxidoreductase subunit A